MMKRLNSENLANQLKNIVLRFPLSLLFIIFLTVWELYTVEIANSFGAIEIVLTTGIILSTGSQLVYERFFRNENKKNMRWFLYGGVIALMVLYYTYFTVTQSMVDNYWTFYSIPGIRGMIIYFIVTILLIWIPSINSTPKFSSSFLAVFKGWFASLFFSIVLYLGIIATLFLFETLFFTIEMDWFSYVTILIYSLFLPVVFLTFIPDYQTTLQKETGDSPADEATKMPKFLHHLITYILIPIMAIYTVLLVMYILTNLSNGFFEENLLEPLLLTYAINGWILLILADRIKNNLAQWFSKIFPILLIFVLVFQMISTYKQIQEVGVTHGRYFILLFGVGTIISALWYILKEPRLLVLPVVAIISGIIALVPSIDAVGLSVRSQVDRVETLLEENNMLVNGEEVVPNPDISKEDEKKLKDSIGYLKGINALNQLPWLSETDYDQVEELLGFTPDSLYEQFFPSNESNIYNVNLMDQNNFSLSVARYDFMLDLMLDNYNRTSTESATIDDQMHTILFDLEDGFVITIQNDETEEEAILDFSYILETFEEDAQLSLEQMIFTEDSGDYTATIVLKHLQVNDGEVMIEFLLFL